MRFGIVLSAIYLGCASVIDASIFRAPIYAVSQTAETPTVRKLQLSDFQVFKQINDTGNGDSGAYAGRKRRPVRVGSILPRKLEQEFMKQMEKEKKPKSDSSGTEIWDWKDLTYTTNFSLGTPPQAFNAMLSISSSDLFVSSRFCEDSCPPGNLYSASASHTSILHSEYTQGNYPRFLAEGQLAEDNLQIAGINIEHQQFGAANITVKIGPDPGHVGWDGILGLAPESRGTGRAIANPFMKMIAQKKLDWNLFSLKVPRGKDDPGEIIFGGVDEDLYHGSLKKLPLVPYHHLDSAFDGRWAVPASGIGIGEGHASLYGYVAVIESDFPGIALPTLYTTLLNKYLGIEAVPADAQTPPSIDCDKRDGLQDLTISLAEQQFVLTPWDYTIEIDLGWVGGKKGVKRCVSAFTSIGDLWEHEFIVLGTPFLRKFYSVFDADGRTVSFGKLRDPKTEEGQKAVSGKEELKRKSQGTTS